MDYSIRETNGVTIIDLKGRLTLGHPIPVGHAPVRDVVRTLVGQGRRRILLNLSAVDYIDSSGVGDIVSSYTTARNAGCELKIGSPSPQVDEVFQITKLYSIFDITKDEASALEAFARRARASVA